MAGKNVVEMDVRWQGAVSLHQANLEVVKTRAIAIRVVCYVAVLMPLASGPFLSSLGRLDARLIPSHFRLLLGGVLSLWPLIFIANWWTLHRRVARVSSGRLLHGPWYHTTVRGIARGDKHVASWNGLRAYRPLPPDDEGVQTVLLVRRDGLHRRINLPADRQRAGEVVAEMARHVPIYNASWHGQIDEERTVPFWVPASLAVWVLVIATCCLLASPAISAGLSKLDGGWRRDLLPMASFVVAFVPCGLWYALVRRDFNPLQRASIIPMLHAAVMLLLLLSLSIACWSRASDSLRYLDTVTPDVRAAMTRTVLPHEHHRR